MMHNWMELHMLGQEKTSEARRRTAALRLPDHGPPELRAGDSAGAGSRRSRRPALRLSPPRRGHASATTLILEQGEVLSLHLPGRSFRVACVAGRLWATVDRSPTDHVLAPGEAQTFRGRGTMVIQALRTATVRIELIARSTGLAGREFRLALRQLGE